MKATAVTKLEISIIFKITEEEAMGLQGLCTYNHETICDHLAKLVHGYEKGSPERKGLISLLESSKALYPKLEEINDVRKKYSTIMIG